MLFSFSRECSRLLAALYCPADGEGDLGGRGEWVRECGCVGVWIKTGRCEGEEWRGKIVCVWVSWLTEERE